MASVLCGSILTCLLGVSTIFCQHLEVYPELLTNPDTNVNVLIYMEDRESLTSKKGGPEREGSWAIDLSWICTILLGEAT